MGIQGAIDNGDKGPHRSTLEVDVMKHSDAYVFAYEYRDLIIGLLVLVLTVLVWAIVLAPAAF